MSTTNGEIREDSLAETTGEVLIEAPVRLTAQQWTYLKRGIDELYARYRRNGNKLEAARWEAIDLRIRAGLRAAFDMNQELVATQDAILKRYEELESKYVVSAEELHKLIEQRQNAEL